MKARIVLPAFLLLLTAAIHAPDHVIKQAGKKFSATDLTVAAGETIQYVNDDAVTHNVFSVTPSHRFNLGVMKPGDQGEIAFEDAGTLEVRCAIHPAMVMNVTVE